LYNSIHLCLAIHNQSPPHHGLGAQALGERRAWAWLRRKKQQKNECHINTILFGPSLAHFSQLRKIKSARSYGYAQIFFFDLSKNG